MSSTTPMVEDRHQAHVRDLLADAVPALRGGEVFDLEHEAQQIAAATAAAADRDAAARSMIRQRTEGRLLAHLVGHERFYGLDLAVRPSVLVPHPATELLVAVALDELDRRARPGSTPRVVEFGLGSGAVSIALLRHRDPLLVHGSDLSPEALELAGTNAEALLGESARRLTMLPVADPLHVAEPFLAAGITEVDLLVANPPYMSPDDPMSTPMRLSGVDPRAVYAPEPDHSWFLRRLLAQAPRLLAEDGRIVVESLEWYVEEHLAVAGEHGWSGEVFDRVSYPGYSRHPQARPASPSGHRVLCLSRVRAGS